jgi:YVTN family beta-propeller protein
MAQTFLRFNSRAAVLSLLIIALVLLLTTGTMLFSSRVKADVEQQASEGRTITPAGSLVMDATTRQPAVGALPVGFVRSPDRDGADGKGRYLISINSGFGLQFNAATNRAQQSLAVIDLNARPAPAVIQNVYFPAPQSANVGVCFAHQPDTDGSYALYVSGGVENKIWMFRFRGGASAPVTPTSAGPNTNVEAPFIDVSGWSTAAPTPRYNNSRAPLYPTGLAISDDDNALFVANNLGDSLGIVNDLSGSRLLTRVDLHHENKEQFIYPYAVVASSGVDSGKRAGQSVPAGKGESVATKVFVSCWNDATIAVINTAALEKPVVFIPVARHPTAMMLNESRNRLYVVNSNADSVSVIDVEKDREIERINVRLSETANLGSSPESLWLDGRTLYVANAHSNSVAVVTLSKQAEGAGNDVGSAKSEEGSKAVERGVTERKAERGEREEREKAERSIVRGFIPTGQYPSAIAVANHTIFIGNGKGTGFENSSVVVNNSGRAPNAPNDRFPVGSGRGSLQGGQYSVSLVLGNISAVAAPDDRALAAYTQQVMRNDGLTGAPKAKLFAGKSPIKHVIYIIKENRTYDQVFGDMERAGNEQPADGDAALAIFGAGEAARRPGGVAQNITPNHHALAARFGLLDRFFANSEASPDGHNWATAAFSNDYVDKAYRWEYGGRGRTYDYEGFNRLPNIDPLKNSPALFSKQVASEDVANYFRRFIPYTNGSRDVGEPETLYLWDAAARAGLTYRNYGEFIGTLSQADLNAINANRAKSYPDLSPNVSAVPTKKSLEGHHSATFRNFDLHTPDAMTIDSYRIAKESAGRIDPLISDASAEQKFHGTSRLGSWLEEFRGFVADVEAGRADRLPNLSILRLSSDHTNGLAAGMPSPQFFVADNDYAVGRLVETVSNSPYWKDTAIVILEDDAQDGPDHVDAHRSVALVISAYNRRGALVHEFHNTVSLIRTIEMLLGIEPMNQLDASAIPLDIFRNGAPDLTPYRAQLPDVALNNLMTPSARDAATAYWMKRTAEQDLSHADMADAGDLNRIIWFSIRGTDSPMPAIARLPAFDAMSLGLKEDQEEEEEDQEEASINKQSERHLEKEEARLRSRAPKRF